MQSSLRTRVETHCEVYAIRRLVSPSDEALDLMTVSGGGAPAHASPLEEGTNQIEEQYAPGCPRWNRLFVGHDLVSGV